MNSENSVIKRYWIGILSSILVISACLTIIFIPSENKTSLKLPEYLQEGSEKVESKKARGEYFHKLLRDPKIDKIPPNIRSKELEFARSLKLSSQFKGEGDFFEWSGAGPDGVGGRTRALAADIRNSDVLIAGGVSGGIWKSTNGGNSWNLKSNPEQNLSVTSLAQDPSNPDTWYYVAGEITGGSTTGIGGGAFLFATGIFISEDNGETWEKIPGTSDDDNTFSSPFDFISRVRVHPLTGSVYISSNGFGILKFANGTFSNPEIVLGNPGGHLFADLEIASDGTIIAAISERSAGQAQEDDPGLYVSEDDGLTWTNITPATYPTNHQRTVVDIAPSNNDIVYAFTYVEGGGVNTDNRLHRLDLSDNSSQDLSDNIPNFGNPVGGDNSQGGYNLEIEVKPDDPDFVLLGTTNLFRSSDGFQSSFEDTDADGFTDDDQGDKFWVGGYDPVTNANNSIGTYPNHHPDQHIFYFDPSNPNKVFIGHDGGISMTEDITSQATGTEERSVDWELMNDGYIVTQFYTIAISDDASSNDIVGGTQDNGTPFFNFGQDFIVPDLSSGDGAFAFITENNIYVSSQNGNVTKMELGGTGDPLTNTRQRVDPSGASGQLFIHPYLVDPNDENIMYYPGGDSLWRNTEMNNFSSNNWEVMSEVSPSNNQNITALDVSTNPANILYIGASPVGDGRPEILKIENANAANPDSQVDISPDTTILDPGSFIHNIHVNPSNPDEVIVIASNFRVNSAFHTLNGGDSWDVIDGNLAGESGPSFRSAAIANVDEEKVYVVGTSIGVFSTQVLDGDNTTWQQESEDFVGNVIINDMDYRRSDETIALGTHGRGAFVGNLMLSTPIEDEQFTEVPGSFKLEQNFPNPFNPSTSIQFSLPTQSVVELTVYDLQGKEVRTLISNETRTAGSHSFNFNAEGLASGVYFYRIQAESVSGSRSFTETRKLTLIK